MINDGPPSPPKAIIFDWDNTLVDSWPVIHEALRVTFDAFGMTPWTLEETRLRVGLSMRDAFPGLFGERWRDAGETFYRRFDEIHLERLQPLPGAAAMLATFKQAGIYLGVVSNKKGEYLRREAGFLGWDGFFGRLIGALDAPRDKPAPEPVAMALSGSGFEAGPGVWFAGDAAVDLECASNAGCRPILLRPEWPEAEEFSGYPGTLHAPDFQALCNFALRL